MGEGGGEGEGEGGGDGEGDGEGEGGGEGDSEGEGAGVGLAVGSSRTDAFFNSRFATVCSAVAFAKVMSALALCRRTS